MKILLRIFKITAILIIAITMILFTASFLMQDKVAGIILKSLNKNVSTKFEFESVRLSFLKRFPNASIDLKNVLVHSSPGYDHSCFTNINTDTLLAARSVTGEFKITDIIKGIYNIERVIVKEGRLNLFTDTAGLVNYEISADSTGDSGEEFTMNLDRINVSDIKVTYNNLAIKMIIKGFINDGRLKTKIYGDNIDFIATSGMQIDLFKLYNFTIAKRMDAEIDVNLHSTEKGITFDKSKLVIDNNIFGLSGFVSSDDVLDLYVAGENLDISGIRDYLPEKQRAKIAAYNPDGILNLTGKIRGPLTRTAYPGIDISFTLGKGFVTYGNSAVNIKDLSFKGLFTNGPGKVPETSSLSISDFKGTLGSAQYTGSLILSDFNSLKGDLKLKGKAVPSELKEYFNLKDISSTEGSIDFDLKMSGLIPVKEKYTISDILSLNPIATLDFRSFGIGLHNDRKRIKQVSGNLMVSDTIRAHNMKFSFRDQKFDLDGMFINLPEWLSGKSVILTAFANIKCDKLLPESFLSTSITDSSKIRKTAYSLPGDIVFDLNFKIDSFLYKTFRAEKIAGTLSYKPRILNFKTLKLNSLEGSASGNGFIVQNTDKSFISRGSYTIEKIDVHKVFTVFHNFSQDFIRAENLAGTVSGTLSLLLPLDSLLNPDYKTMTAEGKYLITDGELIDFGPVKELSSFIELSELENISFEKLENDFFIKNNLFYLPQMEVKSTAADLSVNGKHDFNNIYEYHVKILLSEMLSKKIKKPKPNTTEFGAVKDDGLGRTSFLLKIESRGDDFKVGYDIKAAGNQVKNDIKTERQTLKTILNQEYGWFKNDSAASQKKTTGAPRFKISWGDSDTTNVEKELPPTKEESPIKNLFRKK
jgi:hypothetical protein